jgi:outer membrane protein assembly factor BamB
MDTGEEKWQSHDLSAGDIISHSWFGPTLVVSGETLLVSLGPQKARTGISPYAPESTLFALDANTGQEFWSAEHPESGHASPKDVLVIGNTVWLPRTARPTGPIFGYDIKTGRLVKELKKKSPYGFFSHQRCYRQRAVGDTILTSMQGIEFIDTQQDDPEWIAHHWVRGSCLFGIMPSYGMLFIPPHPCACNLDSKLDGMFALAPKDHFIDGHAVSGQPIKERLLKGPAYGAPLQAVDNSHHWPTYRGDNGRSGRSRAQIRANLEQTWKVDVGGQLSPPTIACNMVFIAQKDEHSLLALDAQNGSRLWGFMADARIDSPPTIFKGRAYLGSRDGCIYCLDIKTGALIWKFAAAPANTQLVAYGQLESLWPVSGSVLIEQNRLYAVAGRSMFLNGGLRMVILDPMSGTLIRENVYDHTDPKTGKNLHAFGNRNFNLPVSMPDILSCDGKQIYMRTQPFDLDGNRAFIEPAYIHLGNGKNSEKVIAAAAKDVHKHLFSPTGFLDDSWWHRTYWTYAGGYLGGPGGWYRGVAATPTGRILAFDDTKVYGFGREGERYGWTEPIKYRLFRSDRIPGVVDIGAGIGRSNTIKFACDWQLELPIYGRALALAENALFVAGPPDLLTEKSPAFSVNTDWREPPDRLRIALDGWEGKSGGKLMAYSATDGRLLAELELKSIPVFDGMAIADGRVYLVMSDGSVLCFEENN